MNTFWQKEDSGERTDDFVQNTSENLKNKVPGYSQQELDPNIFLEDVKLKTVNEAGLNAHSFGLGWQDQMIRVQNDLDKIEGSDVSNKESYPEVVDVSAIKSSIYAVFNKLNITNKTRVFVNNHADDDNSLTVVIQRERLQTFKTAIDNRRRWVSYA